MMHLCRFIIHFTECLICISKSAKLDGIICKQYNDKRIGDRWQIIIQNRSGPTIDPSVILHFYTYIQIHDFYIETTNWYLSFRYLTDHS